MWLEDLDIVLTENWTVEELADLVHELTGGRYRLGNFGVWDWRPYGWLLPTR